jgi:hypothetical protein
MIRCPHNPSRPVHRNVDHEHETDKVRIKQRTFVMTRPCEGREECLPLSSASWCFNVRPDLATERSTPEPSRASVFYRFRAHQAYVFRPSLIFQPRSPAVIP